MTGQPLVQQSGIETARTDEIRTLRIELNMTDINVRQAMSIVLEDSHGEDDHQTQAPSSSEVDTRR